MAVQASMVQDLRSSRSCAFARSWMVAAILVLQSSCLYTSRAQPQQFIPPNNGTCACLNQNLTYTCTADGTGATVWIGTAFLCPTQENREVVLRHGTYNDGTAFGECNDDTIIARGVEVRENRFYVSELVANVSSELSGSTISCQLSSGGVLTPIGSAQINVITGPYQLAPVVRLAQASDTELRFSWTSVDPSCSAISYEMTTSGCGSCSITTDMTTAATQYMSTCTGWQLPSMCMFSVRSVICGFTGMASNEVAVTIKVPDPPQVTIIPGYSTDTNSLIRLFITTTNRQGMGTTTPIVEYITSYSGGMQRNTSCMDDQCEYEVNGPFQACNASASSVNNIVVSATNVFGQGQGSVPLTFGCTNQFLRINYTSSAIVCTFLNTMDTTVKSCTVVYGSCDQKVDQRRASGNSTLDRPNVIEIQLDTSTTSMDCVMYVVTASNDTVTVIVEDTRNMQRGTTSRVVVIATVVPSIVVVAIIIVIIITVSISIVTKQYVNRRTSVSTPETQEHHILEQYDPDLPKSTKSKSSGRVQNKASVKDANTL